MKVTFFEGTPDEFKAVAPYLGGQQPVNRIAGSAEGEELVDEKQAREIRKDAIRIALNRAELTEHTLKFFQILHEGEILYDAMVERMGIGNRGLAGVIGSLGRRLAHTPEIMRAGLPGSVNAMVEYRLEKGIYYLKLTDDASEVLEEEGYVE